ncbi:NUDIX domain-containing protein [Legionella israelensis]|uniref:NUDIX domain-containing protein n=1 Tax=Legionella israelensis TaxID=454 RepID=UPI001CB73041|nr:NUDIX domain-containing protein [Legionella israelensis]
MFATKPKILLQRRPEHYGACPGYTCEFGGKIEIGETPDNALVRELKEELGAIVQMKDVIKLGAITEQMSQHKDLIYTYFWHDRYDTITGCYEGEPVFFECAGDVLDLKKITDALWWLIPRCKDRGLIK